MAKVIDKARFNFIDSGYLEIYKLEGEEIDLEYPLAFNTDMEFISTNADELEKLGRFLIDISKEF